MVIEYGCEKLGCSLNQGDFILGTGVLENIEKGVSRAVVFLRVIDLLSRLLGNIRISVKNTSKY